MPLPHSSPELPPDHGRPCARTRHVLRRPDALHRKALLFVLGIGGVFVAIFELASQYAIVGAGVASAVALLYTAPVMVAILARSLLGEPGPRIG